MKNLKIAFIGGGNMARAIIGGLLAKGALTQNIHVLEINPEAAQALVKDFGVNVEPTPSAALRDVNVWVLAVKPQQAKAVLQTLSPFVNSNSPVVISIMAGLPAADLARWLGTKNIVRCMPNTPALVGAGMSVFTALPSVSAANVSLAASVLQAVGLTQQVDDEVMIDAATAVSGSGPGYVFYFMQAMLEAAQNMGFSPSQAKLLVAQTFVGSAKLAAESPETFATLRERVTSKGGTTYAALSSMESDEVAPEIIKALHAARDRAVQMAQEFGKA